MPDPIADANTRARLAQRLSDLERRLDAIAASGSAGTSLPIHISLPTAYLHLSADSDGARIDLGNGTARLSIIADSDGVRLEHLDDETTTTTMTPTTVDVCDRDGIATTITILASNGT